MRIAVVSDVHGNLAALRAVLADIARKAPDLVINLGDCLSGPLAAAETADLLMDRKISSIRGNHDRELVETPRNFMGLADGCAADQLNERHRSWLRALPATVTIEGLFCFHGTPTSDLEFCTETVTSHGVRVATKSELSARVGTISHQVVLCGHSHIQRLLRTQAGTLVVNPGSVGLQAFSDSSPHAYVIEVGSPHARYAVLDHRDDTWTVTFRTVAYDWESAASYAEGAGRHDWAHALRTGYENV